MYPPHSSSDPQEIGQKWGGGANFQFYLFPRVLREAPRRGWGAPGGRPMVAPMCLSWFAVLLVGEAASMRVVDIRRQKALGFWAAKRGFIGRRWRRWSEWLGGWGGGGLLRDHTKGWEGDDPVVPRGALVYETALAGLIRRTNRADGRWHGHRRGGAAAARAHEPEAWFLSFGRWDDKRTVMGFAKDFQGPRVLGDH